jgi:hypothetical protein
MGARPTRTALLVAFAGALAACGPETISLAPPRTAAVAAVAGAERVSLDVVSQDKRPQFQDRVATYRGTTNRKIVADSDVADYVRGGVEQGLKAEGFVLAAGGLIVTVELQNFYCDASIGTTAAVAFTLRARTGSGRTLYTRYYEGSGSAGTFQAASNCKAALEQAAAAAVDQALRDKALQSALLSATRS